MLACINSYFINTYFGTYCQSNLFQNQFLKMYSNLKKIPILTYFLPQIQAPNGMKQEAESHSTGIYLMMPKGKVVQITKNPRERFSMSLLPRNGDVWAGVGNQLWHKEALRVHIWAAHTEGKESWWFCMQHLVITKVIKITRFTRLGACHCLLHLQMFSFTSQTYSNNPAPMGLQTWAASLNTEGDLLKDCWFIWPWQNVKKWKSNETHRTFLSPWLCLAWIQWTRLISTGSPITDCYLPKLWSKATTRAEERKYLWESLIPLVRNQKSKEPLETLTECKNSSLPSEKGKRPYL